jgi:hypothetical protein
MTPKKIVQEFYKSDVLIDTEILEPFLHKDIILEWGSSTGTLRLDYKGILDYSAELAKSYIRTKARISHIIKSKNMVSVRYELSVKTFENPSEEMQLANFMVIWEIKDDKLYRGYQISHRA